MNILYFDERELWSPKLDELLDEIDETDVITISKVQMQQGKKFTVVVASYT